jgi:NADH:ubiquinone oxidoreductase subunit 2 (subunit N)
MGVAPFHMWFIDVAEGTHEVVLPMVVVIPKISQFSIFFYLMWDCVFPYFEFFNYMCFVFGILSIFFSAFQLMVQ